MKIVLNDDFGGEHEITENVQMLYDMMCGSLDYGSGLLDANEELQLMEVGLLLGDTKLEEIDEAMTKHKTALEEYLVKAMQTIRSGVTPSIHRGLGWSIENEQTYLKGLAAIKEKRAALFTITDDVTNFDDEEESNDTTTELPKRTEPRDVLQS